MDNHRKFLTVSIAVAAVIGGLYFASCYHYLLFHSMAEIFSIIIACAVFMISWNTREHTENHYLVYLGIAYLFIGIIDLFHTLSYKGMNIFPEHYDYPTKFWIAARYMESLSLFAFFIFAGYRKKVSFNSVVLLYATVTSLILASVFYWDIFPLCFVEGKGLTPFKKISEYIICLILIGSAIALYKHQEEFDEYIRNLMAWTIILSIIGELAFTFYIRAYGFSNLVGHYLKIASFYLVYKAIIETGLRNPFDLMFKKVKKSEERYRNLFNTALVGIFRTTRDGSQVLEANPAVAKIFAYSSVDSFTREFVFRDCYTDISRRRELGQRLEREERVEGFEFFAKDRDGQEKYLTLSAVLYGEHIEGTVLDITEQMENRRKIQEAAEQDALQRGKLEMAGSVLHDIGNAVTGLGTTVTRLLGEDKWPELLQLEKLGKMVEQKRDAFAATLGPGKEEALITFVRELGNSLETHSNELHSDYKSMAKTVSHVNEILHLQRRYARDGKAGKRLPLGLDELIEDALAMHEAGFEKRQITVQRHIPHELPRISGDRTRLIRVFLNLFKNMCEAFDTDEKQDPRMSDIAVEPLENGHLRVILSDNAAGFEPEHAELLLEPGFSTKKRDSGMGLQQCRAIIETHGGTIRLESKGKGQGARVIIELPTTDTQGE